uniref:Uncharacterized protein n=1 Tax=viral metagenome TaxID=1070528 RepID=A0A6M3LR36_9ZZZZ
MQKIKFVLKIKSPKPKAGGQSPGRAYHKPLLDWRRVLADGPEGLALAQREIFGEVEK